MPNLVPPVTTLYTVTCRKTGEPLAQLPASHLISPIYCTPWNTLHSVAEIYCDGGWRLVDPSVMNYHIKDDGKPLPAGSGT